MRWLELKVPPPVVALVVAGLQWAAAGATPDAGVPLVYRSAVAVPLLAVAGLVGGWGIVLFVRAKTTVEPYRPHETRRIVVSGPYRVSRNPMYLALLAGLVALGVMFDSPLAVVAAGLFAAYVQHFQIRPEERILEARCGSEYTDYKRRVRRWL